MPFDLDTLTNPAVTADPTVLYRERRERAAALWATIPAEKWDMGDFVHSCGTVGCALGHLGMKRVDGWRLGKSRLLNHVVALHGTADTAQVSAEHYFALSQDDVEEIFGGRPRPAATVSAQLLAAPYVVQEG